ncbi:MAG: hypothetical protein ACXVXO_13665 [Mycobacteriaceae bacterium]
MKALAEHFPIVDDIDDQDITAWITAMHQAGKSSKTISNQHGLLFAVGAYAVKKQLRSTTRSPTPSCRTAGGTSPPPSAP